MTRCDTVAPLYCAKHRFTNSIPPLPWDGSLGEFAEMVHSYVLFMTKYAVLTPPLSDWGAAIAPSRRRVFWVASCVYLGRCFQVFTSVWACKLNILFRFPSEIRRKISSSKSLFFFLFPSQVRARACGGGIIVRNAVSFDGSDSFSDKAGKLVFLLYLLSSGTVLDHSIQGGRTENASQCETEHTSRPLLVSFQNK